MKKILNASLIVLIILMVFSCDLFSEDGLSITERIQSFQDDLNNDNYSNLINHYHPDMVGYDQWKDTSNYDSTPISQDEDGFNFYNIIVSGSSASGSFSCDSSGASGTFSAVMKESDGNWLIYSLTITVGATDFEINP